ncbi:hypothetical protein RB594_001401 [Gaeumannomyces avenae]
MSSAEATDKPAETVQKADEAAKQTSEPVTSAAVFSMFGGGAKKEKKEEEDRGDVSGSAKAQREAAAAAAAVGGDETNEESEEQVFKMRAKLFKFVRDTSEWKERGTGDVRLLKHRENGKTRLVMRRDKTLKVCANHYIVPEMKLSPNVGSDRSWVWNAAADVSEGEPEGVTLAIRFANSENANAFKDAFLQAQKENEALFGEAQGDSTGAEETKEDKKEETPAEAA